MMPPSAEDCPSPALDRAVDLSLGRERRGSEKREVHSDL